MRRLLLALLLLTTPAFAAPPALLHAHLDPTIGAIYSGSPDVEDLSGWLWVAPGDVFGETSPADWALVRVVASSPGALYVWPYPVEDGRHTLRIVESPLLFADGFERGDLWTWSFGRGADPSLLAGGEIAARLAMADSVQWYNVLSFSGLDSGGSTVNVILSERVGGSSGAADAPASERFRYVMRSFNSVSWKAIRQQSGWPDIGGGVDHADYHIVADNNRNTSTNVGPLDDLQDLEFKGQSATMYSVKTTWDSTFTRWYPQSLASSQILWKGTILDASFSGVSNSEFSLSVREQTKVGLAVPASPVEWQGLGGGTKVETNGAPGSGARIIRADVAAGRGTGDQSIAWGFLRGTGDTGSSDYVFFDHPTMRLQRGVAANTIIAQIKNAAGTWQTVGTSPTFSATTFFGILITYDQSTTTAELWVNGASAGTTVITGGIFTSSASSVYWYNAPTTGTMEITHYFFRQWSRLLADSEIEDRSVYSFDIPGETGLIAAVEFDERTGTISSDMTGNAGAVLTGFADANGSWVSSYTGESSMARSRPRVIVGHPFMAAMDTVDVAFQAFSPGLPRELNLQLLRAVVADGKRLAPPISATSAATTFTLADQQIAVIDNEFRKEPAVGQTLNFDTGTNAGNHDCARILTDPRIPQSSGTVLWVADGSVIADDNTSGNWTSSTSAYSQVASPPVAGVIIATVTSGAAEHMAALLQGTAAGGVLAEAYLENLGPVAGSITTSSVASLIGSDVGWQGDGSAEAWGQVDDLARRTPSSDYGPSVVYRDSSAGWHLVGSDLSPASVAYTWDSSRIQSATLAALPGEFNRVRVRYAKAWSPVPAGKITSTTSADPLAREAGIEWREVTSGTGSKELILEAYFLRRNHAQAFADAILSMLSKKLYSVRLFDPILPAEAAMAPFTAVTVDWSADSYLDGGANGIVVGLEVNQDKSATALVFFGG